MPCPLTVRRAVLALAIAIIPLTSAFAQSEDTTRIGAVNLSYILRTSKAGLAALAQIEDAGRKKAAEVQTKAAELQKQQTALQKPALPLTPRAQADLQRAFEKSQLDFERFQQDAQTEMDGLQQKFDAEFRARVGPIIDAVSKEKGLHFVFGLEEAAIVWWSPAVDISEEVVKRLDAAK